MAHFAELDNNNIVLRVIVVADEFESDGKNWCHNTFGGIWEQTSYNNKIKKQYAGVGYSYDAVNDVFIQPQPYPSWTLDENFDWQPPIQYPSDGYTRENAYFWNEETQSWNLLN